ncbi:MAG: ShlB/FhaC/HecB family hemolysin secretion/activation protein [Cyanobacteria bacterium P01_H01_bin.150]
MNKCLSSWLLLLHLGLTITTIFNAGVVKAQVTNPDSEQLSPQDVIPPTPQPLPIPDPNPSPPPPPEDVLPSPQTPSPSDKLSATETITVTEFEFVGNTVLTSVELNQRINNKFIENNLPKTFSLQELLQIAAEVASFYAEKGYSTSGAIISIPEATRNQQRGIVNIKVIEGKLEEINVTGSRRLNRSYIKSRLGVSLDKPLNIEGLQERLQLLSLNPLIKQVSAQLSAGSRQGLSVLNVEFKEAKSFNTTLSLDNGRSPSVGSFQRQIFAREGNVTGLGDALSLGYSNTDGSNSLDASYTLPLNSQNGTLRFSFNTTDSNVIEPPFDDINEDGRGSDIESQSSFYEISLRQPLSRGVKNRTFREFALGISGSLRDSETSLLDEPFPLSPGADDEGDTRVFALRFFQDWTQQNAKEVIAFRSQLSVGLNALNSTVNERIPETGEFVPDSRFFAWEGQAQWVRVLAPETLLLVRANAQLSDQGLLSSEQFTVGGLGSVRGYRQNQLLADNGVFASTEVQIPILRTGNKSAPTGILQIIPFFDIGTAWNNSGIENPSTSTLVSLGMGLQWRNNNDFIARLDWGIPLTDIDSRDRTWQENGLLFSLQWSAF